MSMTGAMDVDGDMTMDGGMNVDGKMAMSGAMATTMKADNTASRLRSVTVYESQSADLLNVGKIVVLDVDGLMLNKNIAGIGSMGENPAALFREKLDAIATDSSIAAIVLRINSPGGGVTASDMMTRDLMQVKSQRNIPVVACLMDVGTGGGYYLATAADKIVSHPTSIVGGIGVIMNVYNLEDNLGQFGVISIPIKAGERIDVASPERMMDQDERAMLQDIADDFHQRFIERVNLARPGLATRELFDGRVITGVAAQSLGLVDQVGYLDDAVVLARNLARLPAEAPLVMLRRDNDRAYTLMDVTPNVPTMSSIIPLKLPGLDRSALPTFLYMWQPDPSFITSQGGA